LAAVLDCGTKFAFNSGHDRHSVLGHVHELC